MNIVFLLIPLALGLLAVAVVALFWAVNSGQYDELEEASQTVLEPDERAPEPPHPSHPSRSDFNRARSSSA